MSTTKTRVLSALVHAAAKVGKSTLTSTAPFPILVLDAEGSWRFIKVRKIVWNPMTEPPPIWSPDCGWDACVVNVTSWEVLGVVAQWLLNVDKYNFRSLVLDSITECQRRLKKNLKGTEAMQIQDWGILLSKMDDLIRSMRDMTLLPNTLECVIFVAETKQRKDGKWAPYMQGAIADTLPYMVDICGYLFVDYDLDENGQPTKKVRRLFIGDHPQFVTGERVQNTIGDVVTNASFEMMIQNIYDRIEIMEVGK